MIKLPGELEAQVQSIDYSRVPLNYPSLGADFFAWQKMIWPVIKQVLPVYVQLSPKSQASSKKEMVSAAFREYYRLLEIANPTRSVTSQPFPTTRQLLTWTSYSFQWCLAVLPAKCELAYVEQAQLEIRKQLQHAQREVYKRPKRV